MSETTVKEFEEACLKHLQGKHNQKRHGWRYTGDAVANARSAMRGQSGAERTEYRARAGMEQPVDREKLTELRNAATRNIGAMYAKEGVLRINTPYDEKLVADLKKLPAPDRKWDSAAGVWIIGGASADKALSMARKYADIVDARKMSPEARSLAVGNKRKAQTEAQQQFIRFQTRKIDARLAKIESKLSSASRSTANALTTEKHMLEYAKHYSKLSYDKLDDIAKKTIAKAFRMYIAGMSE